MLFLRNYRAYGPALNTYDLWKFLAIMLMVVDHVGYFFYPSSAWLRVIGRCCVPIWFFFVGRSHSQRVTWDIPVLAAAMVAGDAIAGTAIFATNILVTIIVSRLLGRSLIHRIVDGGRAWRLYAVAAVMLGLYWPTEKIFEYGSLGAIMALCGHLAARDQGGRAALAYYVVALITFVGLEIDKFAFAWPHASVMALGSAAVLWLLFGFRLEPVRHAPPVWLSAGVKFIARNSLYIYAAHFLTFLAIDAALHPSKYGHLRWFPRS